MRRIVSDFLFHFQKYSGFGRNCASVKYKDGAVVLRMDQSNETPGSLGKAKGTQHRRRDGGELSVAVVVAVLAVQLP